MKVMQVKDLANCPICGAKAVLRKNASKDFQVACTKCEARTGWAKKTDAVVRWYNMMLQMWKNAGKLTLDS